MSDSRTEQPERVALSDVTLNRIWLDLTDAHVISKSAFFAAARAILAAQSDRDNAEIQVLRAALEKLARLGNGDRYGNSFGNDIAIDALNAATSRKTGNPVMADQASTQPVIAEAAPAFDQAEFDAMTDKGTKAWAGVDVSRDDRTTVKRCATLIDWCADLRPKLNELMTDSENHHIVAEALCLLTSFEAVCSAIAANKEPK